MTWVSEPIVRTVNAASTQRNEGNRRRHLFAAFLFLYLVKHAKRTSRFSFACSLLNFPLSKHRFDWAGLSLLKETLVTVIYACRHSDFMCAFIMSFG